jgi:hypothetical protein
MSKDLCENLVLAGAFRFRDEIRGKSLTTPALLSKNRKSSGFGEEGAFESFNDANMKLEKEGMRNKSRSLSVLAFGGRAGRSLP